MANVLKVSEYQSIKNERYTVIVFQDGKRILSHSGVNLLHAMQIQTQCQRMNRTTLIVNEYHVKRRKDDKSCIKWKIEEFADLFELGSDALYSK